MRRSLMWKLIAAFLGVSLFAIALVTAVSAAVTANEFDRFVSADAQGTFKAFVDDYYRTNDSLVGLDTAIFAQVDNDHDIESDMPHLVPFPLTDSEGVVISPGEGYAVGQAVSLSTLGTATPLIVDGNAIGFILPRVERAPNNHAQAEYLNRTVTTLAYASGGTALGAILVGVWLARTITRPVLELTGAAQRLAKGELGQTVTVHSQDELGELAAAFNQMSADLEHADRTRKQMTADIAHELRNPLTVIGGYLDAMQSGHLQPTPKRLRAVHDEIQHLEQIVQDLRTLSLADANALALKRERIAPQELMERVAVRFAPRAAQKQISIAVEAADNLPPVNVDEARLTQVLDNLVSNALRHTPQGGTVRLAVLQREKAIRLVVADTGQGIVEEDLPRVFERFYRADQSRATDEESSGLGLPIAKALIEAHGGKIWAESNAGQGAVFFIELPF